MRPRPLFVIGSGGLAREMAQLAEHVDPTRRRWDFRGFIGASAGDTGRDLGIGSVAGDDAWLLDHEGGADLVVGIGSPTLRARALAPYLACGDRFRYPNVVHPSALVDEAVVSMGQGNAVTAGCIFTLDIQVGDFNLFNWQTTVGHDAVVGSYNVVNPSVNLSGASVIGDRVLIGTGAQVLEGRSIGSDAIVGAGAVVTRDVPPGVTVVGIPARAPADEAQRPDATRG